MAKKYLLTATMADRTAKTIGPTATRFAHYWHIVASFENGKAEVFRGTPRWCKGAMRRVVEARGKPMTCVRPTDMLSRYQSLQPPAITPP